LEVISLGSGSSGNSLLIRTEDTCLLLDCGVGARRMTSALAALRVSITDIDAVLVSHEHADHIRESHRFTAAAIPIVATRGTARRAGLPPDGWVECIPGQPLCVRGVEILPMLVSHDAAEPCGFHVRTRIGGVTVLTDLGCAPGGALDAISDSRLVVIEANYDELMLRRGPYPLRLQRRIQSDLGHLSNTACAELLAAALLRARRLPTLWLAHLSETNNNPRLARQTVAHRLRECGLSTDIVTLPRRASSETWRPDSTGPSQRQLMLGI
jgi:phosphoribosyl 1,2-cyclic phosphodiesterase